MFPSSWYPHSHRYRADIRSCMNVGVRIFCGTVKATVQPDRDEMVDRAVTMRNRSGKDPQRDVDRSGRPYFEPLSVLCTARSFSRMHAMMYLGLGHSPRQKAALQCVVEGIVIASTSRGPTRLGSCQLTTRAMAGMLQITCRSSVSDPQNVRQPQKDTCALVPADMVNAISIKRHQGRLSMRGSPNTAVNAARLIVKIFFTGCTMCMWAAHGMHLFHFLTLGYRHQTPACACARCSSVCLPDN
jgi:hypothetical protein